MEIKSPDPIPRLRSAGQRVLSDRRLASVLAYTLLLLVAGALVYRSHLLQNGVRWAHDRLRYTTRSIRAHMVEPDHITIDIKHEDYLKIAARRQEALAAGVLISSDADFVPATIRHGDQILKVKLRLKGDLSDHWNTDRWSLRVVVRGEQTLFGMKQFSLQHPKTRNYLYEWIYHQTLRREGLIGLRYDFIDVTVNGRDLGTYAIEEHFEKRLVEGNRRREGPIVRFNEDLSWAELLHHHDVSMAGVEQRAGSGSFLSSDVDAFETGRYLEDSTFLPLYLKAVNLLEGFRDGRLNATQTFDVDALGRFVAINELMGSEHGANWRNIRFYYNPITTRLEPIGFDADGGDRLTRIALTLAQNARLDPQASWYDARFWELLFSDTAVQRSYLTSIERVSKRAWMASLLDSLAPDIDRRLEIIRRSNPEVDFSRSVLLNNADYLHRMLFPVKRVHAYVTGEHGDTVHSRCGQHPGAARPGDRCAHCPTDCQPGSPAAAQWSLRFVTGAVRPSARATARRRALVGHGRAEHPRCHCGRGHARGAGGQRIHRATTHGRRGHGNGSAARSAECGQLPVRARG